MIKFNKYLLMASQICYNISNNKEILNSPKRTRYFSFIISAVCHPVILSVCLLSGQDSGCLPMAAVPEPGAMPAQAWGPPVGVRWGKVRLGLVGLVW